jgi:hypothetical protein
MLRSPLVPHDVLPKGIPVAKSVPYSSSKPPSAWAIVLVALLLILLPSLFCAGVLITSNKGPQQTKEGIEFKKREEFKP